MGKRDKRKRYTNRHNKKRYTKKRYTKKRYTKKKIKGGRVGFLHRKTQARNIYNTFMRDLEFYDDSGSINFGTYQPFSNNVKLNILMGLREVEKTVTGENTPWQLDIINDSENGYEDYCYRYRLYLEKIGSLINNLANIFSLPASKLFYNRVYGKQRGGKLSKGKIGAAATGALASATAAGVGVGKLVGKVTSALDLAAAEKVSRGTFAPGILPTIGLTPGAGAAIGAAAAGTAALAVGAYVGQEYLKKPTLFGTDYLDIKERYDILEKQLRKCMNEQGNDPKIAAIFTHQHQLRGLLGIERDDNGEKYGIGNNSMLIFEFNNDLLTCNVLEPKLSVDDRTLEQVSDDHPGEYFAKDKGYNYLKEGNLDVDSLIRNNKYLSELMENLGLKILIFHRHGMAMHNLLNEMEKTKYRKLIRNSRLLPGDMLLNGPLTLMGKKLNEILDKQEDKYNIVWACSELVRTMQSLITVRYGYEMELQTEGSATYNKARILCLRYSLQDEFKELFRKKFEENKRDKAKLLVDSMIAVNSDDINTCRITNQSRLNLLPEIGFTVSSS